MSKIRRVVRASKETGQSTRWYSNKQETAVAKNLGGRKTPNSGATMWRKGDIELDQWLIECKTRTSHSDSISIKKEWLEKNKKEACFVGKDYSALVFSFGPDEENHYIIDEELFQILVEYLKNN